MFARAFISLPLVLCTACVLDASAKTGCRTDGDCNPGRVCRASHCARGEPAVVTTDGGDRKQGEDDARAPRDDASEAAEDAEAEDVELDAGQARDADSAAELDASAASDAQPMEDAYAAAMNHEAGAACACEQAEARVRWRFPSSEQGFYSVDQPVDVRVEQSGMSWLEDVYFFGETGPGAILGFEHAGRRPDGSLGKVAVFAMRGATGSYTEASGATCDVSNDAEQVTTCRIAFDFVPNHEYVWRIWRLADESSLWWWWGAWVLDATKGAAGEVPIAELRGSPGRRDIARSESYVRYGERRCSEPPPSQVHFAPPLLDGLGLRAQTPVLGTSSVSSCRAASVSLVAGGVDVVFGAP